MQVSIRPSQLVLRVIQTFEWSPLCEWESSGCLRLTWATTVPERQIPVNIDSTPNTPVHEVAYWSLPKLEEQLDGNDWIACLSGRMADSVSFHLIVRSLKSHLCVSKATSAALLRKENLWWLDGAMYIATRRKWLGGDPISVSLHVTQNFDRQLI